MKNPLLEVFNTPHQTAPFSKIENIHYLPAFKSAIIEARQEIDAIANSSEKATFSNTIEQLEFSGQVLDQISSIFFNLNSAETNDEIQKIAQEISPELTAFSNDVSLNENLFERVKFVYENVDRSSLNNEQIMLLDKKYKSFARNGANLSESDKEILRSIDTQLSKLKLSFGEHVLADTNAYELWIENIDDLKGLPEGVIAAAKHRASQKGKENAYLFTLDYPSYIPFMTYAENRDLRQKFSSAFGSKGFQDNDQNNESLVLEISKLRFKRAQLLGYSSHAAYVLEERMAEKPEHVLEFLKDLEEKSKPFAEKEFNNLQAYAQKLDQIDGLQPWDGAYYTEKLKMETFNFDEEALKPYLELDSCVAGMFSVAEKLFGLHFELATDIDGYHEDVNVYRVKNTEGDLVSVFYADYFPRAGKRGGAWMTSYKSQSMHDGQNIRPHVSIVCNFTPPTGETPALLTFNELTTLFHEFGHALHGMLANTQYPSLSGTSVSWDFVELPSQMLENWCYEKETLDLFAKHYKTGEKIPFDLVEKIKSSSSFMEGMKTLRQISLGQLDMAWHAVNPSEFNSVKDVENKAYQATRLYPSNPGTCTSTAFSHIFQGGYSSGYYSYKWAEVLDADAFDFFKEKGIFNAEVATLFKENILEKGGTVAPMKLYETFRGKKPTNQALLKRAGLLK
ncbi:MAG: M3 family metallopeptidase [Flavobacteriales bacterium]